MEFLKNIYFKIIAVMGAVIGLLLYWINLKNKEKNALKAQIELADDQKKADLIEAEIKHHLNNRKLLKKEVDDREKLLIDLQEKRKEIQKTHEGMSDQEIESYWSKE